MKTLALALALALSGCAAAKEYVRSVESCLPAPVSVIQSAAEVLLTGGADWRDQLIEIGMREGMSVLNCAVSELVQGWSAPTRLAMPSPQRDMARTRGLIWLGSQGQD